MGLWRRGWGGDQSLFAYNFHGDVVNLVPRSHSVFPLAVGDLGTRLFRVMKHGTDRNVGLKTWHKEPYVTDTPSMTERGIGGRG